MKQKDRDVGVALFTGAVLGGFAFIGSYSGDFLWWYQQKFPNTVIISGFFSVGLFVILLLVLGGLGLYLIRK